MSSRKSKQVKAAPARFTLLEFSNVNNSINNSLNTGTIAQGAAVHGAAAADDDMSDDDDEDDGEASDRASETLESASEGEDSASEEGMSDASGSEDVSGSGADDAHQEKVREMLIGRKALGVSFVHCHILLQPKPSKIHKSMADLDEWARKKFDPVISARSVRPVPRLDVSLQHNKCSYLLLQCTRIKLTGRKSTAKLLLQARLNKDMHKNALVSSILAVGDFATYFVLFNRPPLELKRKDVCVKSLPRQTFMVCGDSIAYRLPKGMTLVAYRLANHSKAKPKITEVPWAVALFHGRLHSYLEDEVASEVKIKWEGVKKTTLQKMKCSILAKLAWLVGTRQAVWTHDVSGTKPTDDVTVDVIENKGSSNVDIDTFTAATVKQLDETTGWTIKNLEVRRCTHQLCQKPLHTVWNRNRLNIWRKKCIHCGALQ